MLLKFIPNKFSVLENVLFIKQTSFELESMVKLNSKCTCIKHATSRVEETAFGLSQQEFQVLKG